MEPPFDELDGVLSTTSGYTDGQVPNPSYEQVSMGRTGHTEAVQIVYDPSKVSYERLLEVFWRNIDPTDGGGQFVRGGDLASGHVVLVDVLALVPRLAAHDDRALAALLRAEGHDAVRPVAALTGGWGRRADFARPNVEGTRSRSSRRMISKVPPSLTPQCVVL